MFFFLKLILLLIGALYIFVAYQDAKGLYPFMLRIFGKQTAAKLGKGMSRILMFVVGGVVAAFALWWILP